MVQGTFGHEYLLAVDSCGIRPYQLCVNSKFYKTNKSLSLSVSLSLSLYIYIHNSYDIMTMISNQTIETLPHLSRHFLQTTKTTATRETRETPLNEMEPKNEAGLQDRTTTKDLQSTPRRRKATTPGASKTVDPLARCCLLQAFVVSGITMFFFFKQRVKGLKGIAGRSVKDTPNKSTYCTSLRSNAGQTGLSQLKHRQTG